MLSVETTCNIGDFIDEVEKKSGKYGEVEAVLFALDLYPAGFVSSISTDEVAEHPEWSDWVRAAFTAILMELKVDHLQIIENH